MALNQLSEKLDQLSEYELGFEFDDAAVWSKLEQRLDSRKAYTYWWVVAACLLVGLTFLPISLLKEATIQSPAISSTAEKVVEEAEIEVASINDIPPQRVVSKSFKTLEKKGIATIQIAEVSTKELSLEPITTSKRKKKNKPAFAAEDISIIQASLERPKIEKGKSITVRAQLQSFPDHIQSNQKVLKIKLYEKH